MQRHPMDPDLIIGLAKLSKIERVPKAAIIGRALRRKLEQKAWRPRQSLVGPSGPPVAAEAGERPSSARLRLA